MQPIISTSSAVLDGQGNDNDDTQGHRQVGAFLAKCDLQQYYSTFIDEGFDQLEAVRAHLLYPLWEHTADTRCLF